MIIKNDNLVYTRGSVGENIYLFTANSTIRANGNLVMGAGCAKTVRDTYTGIDKLFGELIEDQETYGVKFATYPKASSEIYQFIGAFQTKIHWQNESPLWLVEYSIGKLQDIATRRPQYTFHLPCPAISHGKRTLQEVLPLLGSLPDNVIVYIDK